MHQLSPVIVLIGQKNVGKSTLFNRLTHTNSALISKESNLGCTRDRQYGYIQYNRNTCIIIDTGELNRFSNTIIQKYINNQTILAIKESSIVFFMVNGHKPISLIDYDISNYLRKLGKDIFIIVNKIDRIMHNSYNMSYDYYSLGIKNIISISAMHGDGINKLLSKVFLRISKNYLYYKITNSMSDIKTNNTLCNTSSKNVVHRYKIDQFIKLAVVGRPNSGKSTFINYILKTNRMITSEIPGTTRDSIYISTIYNNQKYIFVDTAGVRRKNKIHNIIEKMSVFKTLQVLKNVHLTLFMIDINEGVVDQDLSLLKLVLNISPALIVVINKCDKFIKNLSVKCKSINTLLFNKSNFLNNAKIHFISSIYGNGINILFQSINQIYQNSTKIIHTAQLTRIMHQAITKYPPPFLSGTRISPKPRYVHIGGYNPTVIVIHGTQVSKLSNEYQKYLKQFFYQSLNLQGISIHIRLKDTVNPFRCIS